MLTITHANDIYSNNLKCGDKFIFKGRSYTFYGYAGGTITATYETFKVWNSKGKITLIKLPANNS